jgi:hypothetical protein
MPFLHDPFTGEAGITALNLHAPAVGSTWVAMQTISGGSANPMRVQPNAGDPYCEAPSGVAWWRNLAVPPTPDYRVTVSMVRSGFGGNNSGALGRIAADGTFYKLEINEYSNQLRLLRLNDWVETVLGTYSFTPTNGSHAVELEMIGNAIKAYLSTVERISVVDSTPLTAAGYAGMCLSGPGMGFLGKSITAENLGVVPSAGMRRAMMGIG